MEIIVATLILSLVMSLVLGFLLGFFKKVFHVEIDPTESAIRAVLPGASCGACGYPGCDGLASAISRGDAPVNACSVGGAAVAEKIGKIMGVDGKADDQVALLICQGTADRCKPKAVYNGIKTCMAAKIAVNGTKLCDFGCIGFGDCERVCPFDAIKLQKDGLPRVDYRKCTGCGLCVRECPQNVLVRVPLARKGAIALCANRNQRKALVAKDCKAGCIKCGKCERVCPKQCIRLAAGIPLVDYALCDSCGECVSNCPTGVLALIEKKVPSV